MGGIRWSCLVGLGCGLLFLRYVDVFLGVVNEGLLRGTCMAGGQVLLWTRRAAKKVSRRRMTRSRRRRLEQAQQGLLVLLRRLVQGLEKGGGLVRRMERFVHRRGWRQAGECQVVRAGWQRSGRGKVAGAALVQQITVEIVGQDKRQRIINQRHGQHHHQSSKQGTF